MIQDPEESVRIAAAEALFHIGDKETTLPTLLSALKSDNLLVRVPALNVLQMMGKDAIPAYSAIKAIIPEAPWNYDYDSRAAIRILEQL